jgi:hypothetical protein
MRSYGYLRYDPKYERGKGKGTAFKDRWMILQASIGLTKYYQWWLKKEATWDIQSKDWLKSAKLSPNVNVSWPITQKGIKTVGSAWGPHISVIRGDRDFSSSASQGVRKRNVMPIWGKYENKKIWFEFNPEYLNTNGKHWWIRVKSLELEEIREELGLTPQPTYYDRRLGAWRVNPFHITIGHMLI